VETEIAIVARENRQIGEITSARFVAVAELRKSLWHARWIKHSRSYTIKHGRHGIGGSWTTPTVTYTGRRECMHRACDDLPANLAE